MAATLEVGFVHFFTQITLISVGEEGDQTRFTEGEDPYALLFAVQGFGVGRRLDRRGQTFQIVRIIDH